MPAWPGARLHSHPASSPQVHSVHGPVTDLIYDAEAVDEGRYPVARPSGRGGSVGRPGAVVHSHSTPSIYLEDTLHELPELGSPPRMTARHARSISHPFPTLSDAAKKANWKANPAVGFESTDDDDDDDDDSDGDGLLVVSKAFFNPIRRRSAGGGDGRGRGGGREGRDVAEGKQMVIGRCMTCDNLLRWPRQAPVFRCTVCWTTNDLRPRPDRGGARPLTGNGPAPRPTPGGATSAKDDGYHAGPLQTSTDHSPASSRGSSGGANEQQRPPNEIHVAPWSTEGRLSPPAAGSDNPPTWEVPKLPVAAGPAPDSTSSTSWIPSPLEQVLRENEIGQRPPAPTRTPPPPPFPPVHGDRSPSRVSEAGSVPSHGQAARLSPHRRQHSHRPPGPSRARSQEHTIPIFAPLEDYLLTCFDSWDCINSSFSTARPPLPSRSVSEGQPDEPRHVPVHDVDAADPSMPWFQLDAKTLLLGDVAENGSWWTGHQIGHGRPSSSSRAADHHDGPGTGLVTSKNPRIDWAQVNAWYQLVLRAGSNWRPIWTELDAEPNAMRRDPNQLAELFRDVEHDLFQARAQVRATLLRATESLSKRPGRPLKAPHELRFLLILLANPLLYAPSVRSQSLQHADGPVAAPLLRLDGPVPCPGGGRPPRHGWGLSEQHAHIVKRILGLLANLPSDCPHTLVAWFARLSEHHLRRLVELVGSFVTSRLSRHLGYKERPEMDPTAGLIPHLSGARLPTSAQFHAALGIMSSATRSGDQKPTPAAYSGDWQVRAAAKVMALLFAANNSGEGKRAEAGWDASANGDGVGAARARARSHGQTLPTSDFYNGVLDSFDLVADFDVWETRPAAFSFCKYPFFLGIGAKIRILEHDARRQMESKAREAFFDSLTSRTALRQHLVLKVRRDCLVEDSLRGVSEVIGAGPEEIKKSLRIEFVGEEGVDAGGLRKEWFLLLVRDVFDPLHGLFVYDDDSRYCYFNPHCFETSDQFFLIGVLFGLAIYNSTILDVALPPFAFKKLLASAPVHTVGGGGGGGSSSSARPAPVHLTLDDLAEYRPALARGLRQLLEYDGEDVEAVFCHDFVADTSRYGQTVQTPLCAGGDAIAVTKANRREFVDLYVRHLLDTAVARQFEPFKRGFYTVCTGHALALFRPQEIELLVRGSDDVLDVSSLRAVAVHDGWEASADHRPHHDDGHGHGPDLADPADAVLDWFWDFFGRLPGPDQRKLLGFITGSDRIPALGATRLVIKLVCLGPDCDRFPIARTCFNLLGLWRYGSRRKLEQKLWRAVVESEGFGLK
ncbi:MAG: putative E3 ubiquitin-protein ligase [Phylliscum demangeonii]|nr:MAG: putative E3 ubiquitin-protein ligase [Phylliscum demangeonii]